ncbi:MAG: serine--tRNA ligase [Elusimicrobia bacterium CG08_land_8_20_14_0_20_44_26]|nr:MAG: serine--tRNA ligase [Elusimicrobia bacterium CG08_land_8_20_14_0_20_44_26]
MIDIKLIRENPEVFKKRLSGRFESALINEIIKLDGVRRESLKAVEELRARQKKVNNPDEGKLLKEEKKKREVKLKEISSELEDILASMPNIPDEDVPEGDAANNRIIRTVGEVDGFSEGSIPHWEIGKMLDIIDFETASSITASFWPFLKGDGARLEAAMLNFFTEENDASGFTPLVVPYLVNENSAFGTGQLPKFAGDLYKTEDGLYLIPTGEVPAGNLFRNKIIDEDKLPLKFQISTPCFRREAGSWGKLGKGLIRNHQFHKVEIFEYVKPADSPAALDEMVGCVSAILQKLKLTHRVVLLASQDMGFAASKTYDIEVWMKGMKDWLEVSSCSNCRDFQMRRTKTRYRSSSGEILYPHTLNASAVAVGRVFAALCESGWDGKGCVILPECLHKFMKKDSIFKQK